MRRFLLLILIACAACPLAAAGRRARNVILFIGDAGGIPTLHAGSLYAHDAPQKLFIQNMPHIGLMDTSAANGWVTDSAAGMTAIVTGEKTNGGVLSQAADTVRGKTDGRVLKTILEYAEEKGLSTGVLSNMSMADATPAACYANANDRKKTGEIFAQVLKPRYGDGVDLVIGAGRKDIYAATEKMGIPLETALKEKGYATADTPEGIPADARRVVALFNTGDFEPWPAVERAISILSKNRKGFFLMVEWDMHTSNLKRGLDRVVAMDDVIKRASERMKGTDTLIVFAADHSYDLRVRGGRKGEPLLPPPGAEAKGKPALRVEDGHTGEEVLVAAMGPGAERVKGFFPNTQLFHIMMAAYGWKPTARVGP